MNNPSIIKVGTLILCAGVSKRLGSPKALLDYDKDQTFLEKIINEYSKFGCSEIIVIVNNKVKEKNWEAVIKKLPQNVLFITNNNLEYERFFSVKIGLQQIINSDYCFIQNIDNPFVDKRLLNSIFDQRIENGYVSPRFNGQGGHPILLGKEVIYGIRVIKENNLNFRDVMANYISKKVEIQNQNILININTTEEYSRYFKAGN